ncbi:MAG: LPS export ABC transporter periplasmic protein LptC [Gammaproteobacteria bacterium]|nr:LPS export ABC transporter periplasmic protein LptC [Gammaproteobacteria bacterium]MBU1656139.1 LPS export ABC transporter periplasmic protein LptC [Gammaproteobacteria bacterium]MBU1960783.1 LPS export ABC transporter periplasmic protein LptC [Gammaproteobacteria bacterium]
MDRENLLWTCLFIGLALFTWWLNSEDQAKQPARVAKEGHFPDHYAENLVATEMSELGFPARSLTAQRMVHYADDSSSEFVRPRMTVFEGEKPPWVIRSSNGWMSGNGVDLLLQGEVDIDREAGEGVRPAHLTTRDLRVNTETEFAQTERPVFVISLNDKVESVGMQAWLKAPMRVQLQSKVKGRYEVEHK